MFVPQHSAAQTFCTFPVSVTGCHSCRLQQVTGGLWKSLQRLFLAMIWALRNCFWKDNLGFLQGALEEASQRHTLSRAGMPSSPISLTTGSGSFGNEGWHSWALVTTSHHAWQKPGRCTAQDCNRQAFLFISVFPYWSLQTNHKQIAKVKQYHRQL